MGQPYSILEVLIFVLTWLEKKIEWVLKLGTCILFEEWLHSLQMSSVQMVIKLNDTSAANRDLE